MYTIRLMWWGAASTQDWTVWQKGKGFNDTNSQLIVNIIEFLEKKSTLFGSRVCLLRLLTVTCYLYFIYRIRFVVCYVSELWNLMIFFIHTFSIIRKNILTHTIYFLYYYMFSDFYFLNDNLLLGIIYICDK